MSQQEYFQTTTLIDHAKNGLSHEFVEQIREKFGVNVLPGKSIPSNVAFFLRQLASPLILVLLAAASMTALLQHWTDTGVILAAVLLNCVLGFYQEKKAFSSLHSLKSVLLPEAWVVRAGKKQKILVKQIVPFDVLTLYEGDRVPADGAIIEAHDLYVTEAILTGESISVEKQPVSSGYQSTVLADLERILQHQGGKKEMSTEQQVFMGTTVAGGSGLFIVTKTGMNTEMGSIAAAINEESDEQTPLELRLHVLAKNLAVLVLFMTVVIFLFGLVTERDFLEMFTVSVALAVSAIPEGLAIALTSILAIGMHRILKRKALVRNLVAAETLGTVTVVCLDKTGTLTEGSLRVVATAFTDPKVGYRVSVLANEQRDPLELARWSWAESFASSHRDLDGPHALMQELQRDDLIPFSSERRFIATRYGAEIAMMGAPDTLINYCAATITASDRKEATQLAKTWAESGRRVIAAVRWNEKSVANAKQIFAALKKNQVLTTGSWIGVMGFEDPVRPSVAKTLSAAERAGITVKIITGDYRETAQAVLASVGRAVADDAVLEGYQLLDMTDLQLQAAVKKTVLFARTKPSQKLRIVKALKASGEIVAMMGDGVNDAPALSAADIGLVVGNATEVAQEVADIVLLDSNFETILAAVEEGRGIFANLRKVILYLLSDTFSEVILVMGSMFMGLPIAVTATQVLWINIVKEALPSLALVIDSKEKHLLKQPPINPTESLLHAEMKFLIFAISVVTGLSTLLVFAHYSAVSSIEMARTMAFALLSVSSLLYIFSCRSFSRPFWHVNLFHQRYLFAAVGAAFTLTIIPIYFSPLATVLGLTTIGMRDWFLIGLVSFAVVSLIESIKFVWTWLDRRS